MYMNIYLLIGMYLDTKIHSYEITFRILFSLFRHSRNSYCRSKMNEENNELDVFEDAAEFHINDDELDKLVQLPTQEIEATQENDKNTDASICEESR